MNDGLGLTHASFFSGVGGLDLGLERAGWRTVSFSEIDPYASAVLAQWWPGVPNLGDIAALADAACGAEDGSRRWSKRHGAGDPDWQRATLWSGGFPCQDLSVAGKRRGLAGERSGLAFAFLDLVERYRPPAILLENVPGLLSSNRGRDMAALLGRLVELGYGVAYRVLDAQHFGVPQRRRRVFILALRSGHDDPDGCVAAERAAQVLSVGSRCPGHPPTGVEAGSEPVTGTRNGVDIARAITGTSGKRHDADTDTLISGFAPPAGPSPDARRVRAADGLAGWLDDSRLAATLNSGGNSGGFRTEPGEHLVPVTFMPARMPEGDGTVRERFAPRYDDASLPVGLDSHRYRCCGNGVVSNVSEWIGLRLTGELWAA